MLTKYWEQEDNKPRKRKARYDKKNTTTRIHTRKGGKRVHEKTTKVKGQRPNEVKYKYMNSKADQPKWKDGKEKRPRNIP